MKRNLYLLACALLTALFLSSCTPACVTSGFTPDNATSQSCGPITLSWPADPDAIDYDVYFDAGSTATTLVSQYQTGTTYTTAPLTPGTYTWKIIPNGLLGSASGCASFTFTIASEPPPSALISATIPDTICNGATIKFSSTIGGGGTSPTYQWIKNGVTVGTNSPDYIAAGFSRYDTVSLIMTSSVTGGCNITTVANSNKIVLSSYVIPTIPVTARATTDTILCNGGSATMTTNAVGNYQWQVHGADWPGATQATFSTYTSGDWTVKVSTPTNRCPSISNIVHLNLNATPTPLLINNGTTLSTSANYTSYQWYRNGILIAGANSASFTYTSDGFYKVAVVDANGCSGSSSSFPVNNLAIGTTVNTDDLKIFPNPTTGLITINTSALLDIIIQNTAGQVVMNKKAANKIDITPLANGIYFLQLVDKNDHILKTEKIFKR